MQSLLQIFQHWIVSHTKFIQILKLLAETGSIFIFILGSVIFFLPGSQPSHLYEVGKVAGYLAIITYWLTLIPGMLSRLRLTVSGVGMLTTFRRTLGVLMFWETLIHMMFTLGWPMILGITPLTATAPRLFGMGAVLVLIPLWITSNDLSMKVLGRKWKLIQRLTYLSLFLIFIHVSFFRGWWKFPTFLILLCELISWVSLWWREWKESQKVSISTQEVTVNSLVNEAGQVVSTPPVLPSSQPEVK